VVVQAQQLKRIALMVQMMMQMEMLIAMTVIVHLIQLAIVL
jgi:hypothetical protein